jgi:hypothetical protein
MSVRQATYAYVFRQEAEESSNTSHIVDPALSHEGIQTTGYETNSWQAVTRGSVSSTGWNSEDHPTKTFQEIREFNIGLIYGNELCIGRDP